MNACRAYMLNTHVYLGFMGWVLGFVVSYMRCTDFFRHRPFRPCLHVLFDAWMLLLKNMVSLMLTKWPKGCRSPCNCMKHMQVYIYIYAYIEIYR